MTLSTIDQQYLKVVEDYPYNLEMVVENLQYVASYSDEHAGIAYLMGRIYYEQFYNFEVAEEYFQTALALDNTFIKTYCYYAELLTEIEQFDKAKKLIEYSLTIPGISKSTMLLKEAKVFEKQGKFKRALKSIKKAQLAAIYDNQYCFLKSEKSRIEEKIELIKPKDKKKNKSAEKSKTKSKTN